MADRLTTATIDLQNYSHNISELLKRLKTNVKLMAIVKANAYGHGIEKIADTAIKAGASYLGVASLGELKRIRNAGIKTPVLLLGYADPASIEEIIKFDGAITVMDEAAIQAAQAAAISQNKKVNIHLKIDTGMHRAGCDPDELVSLAEQVEDSSHLELEGVFTHFAESEALDSVFTQQQLKIFTHCLDVLKTNQIIPPLIHCANSAAVISMPETHFTMVRPGLITYGLNPFDVNHPQYRFVAENFKPVLSLKTSVAYIRIIEPGETVGYNRRWTAKRTSTLALLPVGYGDGYRRTPHNAGKVLVKGTYAPIVGSVSMDQVVIDVTEIDDVSVGDEVVLLGIQGTNKYTADDIAIAYDTINYEIVTSLADRIVREYITK